MISEKSEAKKRGRPKVVEDHEVKRAQLSGPTVGQSRRQMVNVTHAQEVLDVLMPNGKNVPMFSWLYNPSVSRETSRFYKTTILTELSRWDDVSLMKELAFGLCRIKPRTKDAVQILRSARLKGETDLKCILSGLLKPDPEEIANAIVRAIKSYKRGRPNTNGEHIKLAFQIVAMRIL